MAKSAVRGKTVLVTGGSGSIGSEIVRECLKQGAKVVRIFSRDETRQYRMQQSMCDDRLRFLIGDVRDRERLRRAMHRTDLVFHAAAMKQVPYCEYNPFEAVQTNVVGAQNLVDAALDAGVSRVVAISTDKAVNPVNTMGATKLLSERIVTRANLWARSTMFSCVRFGNVLGSRGSVTELIEQQVLEGGPVRLTDKTMTRFMMSIPQAASLVLGAASLARAGETFVLPMKALRVEDLVTELRDLFCRRHGRKTVPIKVTGRRPGEKLHEELVTQEELHHVRRVGAYMVIENIPNFRKGAFAKLKLPEYLSDHASLMTRAHVRTLLRESGLL